jgi:hypothetical protein
MSEVTGDAWATAYVTFTAAKLGLPLSPRELEHAALRAVARQKSLAPLYEAAKRAPVDGAIVFRVPEPGTRMDG